MGDRGDGDGGVAVFVGNDHGLLGDAADAHDRGVRLVDDGESKHGSELTGIGNGEGGSFDVFRLKLFGAGTLAEVGDAALQAEEVEIACVLQDGNNEPPIESDGDSHVDLPVITDV